MIFSNQLCTDICVQGRGRNITDSLSRKLHSMPYSVFVLAHYFNPTPITVRLIAPKRFPENQLFQQSHTATQHVSPLLSTFFFFVTLDGGWKALHSMSAPAGSRLVLRHSRFVIRLHGRVRNASTTSDAAQAASDTAAKSKKTVSNISSKASEGLSRVTSSAGPALNGAAQRVNGVLSRVGGRTGRLISFTRCKLGEFPSSGIFYHQSIEYAQRVYSYR